MNKSPEGNRPKRQGDGELSGEDRDFFDPDDLYLGGDQYLDFDGQLDNLFQESSTTEKVGQPPTDVESADEKSLPPTDRHPDPPRQSGE